MLKEPLVSVVTPVFNGEKYISECIESVLKQSYKNWEYIILNNCSTDRTKEIAQEYSAVEPRIRIVTNSEVLPIMKNWNHAMRQISDESKYCKVVHADDWIFPECIEKMVDVAERKPSVGIVGSYGLKGNKVVSDRLPFPAECIDGREVCRMALKMEAWPFPRPTSLLIRSDLIRKKDKFYNEPNLQADHEACYDILREYEYGFVHQVLTYMRVHEDSVSRSEYDVFGKLHYTNLALLKKYGPIFLRKDEYEEILKERMKKYNQFLAYSLFKNENQKFWDYQKESLHSLGYNFKKTRMYLTIFMEFISTPRKTSSMILNSIRNA